MTAITAVTVQNTTGVKTIIPIKPKEISNQIEFTARDIKPNAIKIGMLHSAKVISAVMKSLKKIDIKKIVLDPVMVAKGGTKLINNEAIDEIKKKLMKKILLITPNIPEAELLTNTKINSLNDMIKAGQLLINLGAKNVLIKGGHLKSNEINDILLNKKIIKIFKNKKYKSKNTHGTGCTLSSAIATNLSCGKDLIKSCEQGIKYVNEAIKSNLNYGKGNGPINHLNSITLNKKFK
jgi:hydroxymethylpyrimidine/phosphomethylpyrimidine kinase